MPTEKQRLLLAWSDERDQWEKRLLAAEKNGYTRGYKNGYTNGYRAGRTDEATDRETAWQHNAGMIVASTWPDSPRGKCVIDTIVRGADAATRRQAWQQWCDWHRNHPQPPQPEKNVNHG